MLWVEVKSQARLLLIAKALKQLEPQKNVASMGEKNVKGRKRHIVTDSQGHLLYLLVHRANIHDTIAGKEVLKAATEKYPSIAGISADAGYRKTTENFVTNELKKTISISERISGGWMVLARRWIVERTFAWFNLYRRLAKDYQMTTRSAEALAMIAHSALLLKRLA